MFIFEKILKGENFDKGITEFETRWIGWAGVNVTNEIGKKSLTKALADKVDCMYIYL